MTAAGPVKGEAGCAVIRSGFIPARGYLADPAGLEAGNFWWQASDDGSRICSGVVQMWLLYPRRENAEWLAGIYRGPALVTVIADRDYVMSAGWHSRQFAIRPGAGAAGSICVAVRLGRGHTARLARSCTDPGLRAALKKRGT
jgi:hypothetical protein